jgi:hypothetical protein
MRSIKRLGYNDEADAHETFAMMERTVEIEAHSGGSPSLLDLWKGTDLRRTLITCLVYASQNFAGNLIANQATFFFERAGMDVGFVDSISEFLRSGTDQYLHRRISPSSSVLSTHAFNSLPPSCQFPSVLSSDAAPSSLEVLPLIALSSFSLASAQPSPRAALQTTHRLSSEFSFRSYTRDPLGPSPILLSQRRAP